MIITSHLLADATPSANNVWLVIVVLASVAGNISQVFIARSSARKQNTEISPQPLIIAMEKEFATKREFERHVSDNRADHEGIFKKIGGVERGAASNLETRVETLRKDLMTVGNQVSSLQSATQMQNQQLARMDSKLDRLAERHT